MASSSTDASTPSYRVDILTGIKQTVIIILDCGGTISCCTSDAGLQPQEDVIKTWLDDTQSKVNQIRGEYTLQVEHCFSKDSSDLQPADWSTLAVQVNLFIGKPEVKGIIITHGTDTLAFTASALTFALPYITKPIILTASQFPLLDPISDAPNNLLGSLCAAASENLPPEVMVYFDYQLFLGHRIQKISATDIDAFDTPNAKLLGRFRGKVELDKKISTKIWAQRIFFCRHAVFEFLQSNRLALTTGIPDLLALLRMTKEIEVRRFLEDTDDVGFTKACRTFGGFFPHVEQTHNVLLLELFPGICPPSSLPQQPHLKQGVVIRAFGTGNGPLLIQEWLDTLDAEVLVAVCTSCLTGFVSADYGASLKGNRQNVALCSDMTIEACFCKMTYLPPSIGSMEDKVKHMEKSVRGELTKRCK